MVKFQRRILCCENKVQVVALLGFMKSKNYQSWKDLWGSIIQSWFSLYLFIFWPGYVACRILAPQPGMEPGPLQWNCRVLTPGLPGNSLIFILKIGKIRPEERKWRLGAKLNLRPRCPDSQFRTLNATPYLRWRLSLWESSGYGKGKKKKKRGAKQRDQLWEFSSAAGAGQFAGPVTAPPNALILRACLLNIKFPCSVLSHSRLFATLWTVAHQAPVYGISQARILEWIAISSFKGSSQSRDQTCVSCTSCSIRWILYPWATGEFLLKARYALPFTH